LIASGEKERGCRVQPPICDLRDAVPQICIYFGNKKKGDYYSVVKGLDLKSCPEIVSSQDIGYQ